MSLNVNDAIADWLTGVLLELGDPAELHDHADALRNQAQQVRDLHVQLASQVSATSWSGADARAFSTIWQQHHDLAEQTSQSLESAAVQVDQHADHTWEIVKEVIGIALEILETLAIGIAMSWLLQGLADLIWARVAPLIERVLQLLADFRAMLARLTDALTEIGSAAGRVGAKAGELLGKGVESFVVSAPANARGFAGFYIADAASQVMAGQPVDWKNNAWQIAAFTGLDIGHNLVAEALEATKIGKSFKGAIEAKHLEAEGDAAAGPVDGPTAPGSPSANPGTLLEGGRPPVDAQSTAPDLPFTPEIRSVPELDEVLTPHGIRDAAPGEPHPVTEPDGGPDLRPPAEPEVAAKGADAAPEPIPQSVRETEAPSTAAPAPETGAAKEASLQIEDVHQEEPAVEAPSPEAAQPKMASLRTTGPDGHAPEATPLETPTPELRSSEAPSPDTQRPEPRGDFQDDGLGDEEVYRDWLTYDRELNGGVEVTSDVAVPDTSASPAPRPATHPPSLHPETQPSTPPRSAEQLSEGNAVKTQIAAPHPNPRAPESVRLQTPPGASTEPGPPAGHTLPRRPSPNKPFEPKTGRESLYAGLKEGFNTMIGNMEMSGIVAHVTGQQQSGKDYALDALSGIFGGTRQGLFHVLPVGERFGYRNQPEGSPSVLRWISSTPLAWSYYGIHLTSKTAIMNAINGQTTPTEIN
ncbi:WXG100 family type VII secretion target [Streptomyces sp. NPDC005122]